MTKSGGVTNQQKMCMIRGKGGYVVLSLIKKLLFYRNFSPKYVLFVKSFKEMDMGGTNGLTGETQDS